MQSKEVFQREIHYDLLRIFSIFCMMMLHVAATNWYKTPVESFEWNWFNIYDSIVRFCVPVFVMISGVFFLNPTKEISIKVLFKKYVFRIVIVFLIWSSLYAFAYFFIDIIQGEGLKWSKLLIQIIAGEYHLWFLYMIAGLYLVVPFLKKITANKHLVEFYLVLWFVFSIMIPTIQDIPMFSKSTVITDKMHFFFVIGYSGYFVLGYYLNTYKLSRRMESIAYVMGIVGVVSTILITQYLSINKGEPISTYYGYLKPNVMLVAIAIFILFNQRISKIQFSEKHKKTITIFSAYSFGMYLVHVFVMIFLKKIKLSTMLFNPIFSVPLISIAVFLISFLIIHLLRKNALIRKYMT